MPRHAAVSRRHARQASRPAGVPLGRSVPHERAGSRVVLLCAPARGRPAASASAYAAQPQPRRPAAPPTPLPAASPSVPVDPPSRPYAAATSTTRRSARPGRRLSTSTPDDTASGLTCRSGGGVPVHGAAERAGRTAYPASRRLQTSCASARRTSRRRRLQPAGEDPRQRARPQPGTMVAPKLAAMQAAYDDFEVLDQTEDAALLHLPRRATTTCATTTSSGSRCPATATATLEMSVVGRSARPGRARGPVHRSSPSTSPGRSRPQLRCPWVCDGVEHRVAVAWSSLRTWTQSSRLAATWTTRSTMTPPPGQPVEDDGQRPGRRRCCRRPASRRSRTRGAAAAGRAARLPGSSPTKTPCAVRRSASRARSPTESAG